METATIIQGGSESDMDLVDNGQRKSSQIMVKGKAHRFTDTLDVENERKTIHFILIESVYVSDMCILT